MATLSKASDSSPWVLSQTTAAAGTRTYNLATAGTFLDRNIGVSVTTPSAVGSLTLTAGNGSCLFKDATNVTTSASSNNSGCYVRFDGKGSVSGTAAITTAGWAPASNSYLTASAKTSNTATGTIYINGVTISAPSSGTRYFDITVPNGNTTDTITFRFTVDADGNVTVAPPD